jgi:hypothetical protein
VEWVRWNVDDRGLVSWVMNFQGFTTQMILLNDTIDLPDVEILWLYVYNSNPELNESEDVDGGW